MTQEEKQLSKATEIIDALREMRKLQKEYFATRDSQVLQNSKKAERRVDALLAAYNDKTLF